MSLVVPRPLSRALLTLCLVGSLASYATAQETDDRLALRMYHGESREAPVTVFFDGWVQPAGERVALPPVDLTGVSEAQARIAGYFQALAAGSRTAILPFWAPSEREQTAEKLSDAALQTIRRFHQGVERLTFYADVEYGPYLIVLVQVTTGDRDVPRYYSLKRSGDLLYLTNELSSDAFFGIVAPALAKGLAEDTVERAEGGLER